MHADTPKQSFARALAFALFVSALGFQSAANAQTSVSLSGSTSLSFAVDATDHFLYAAQVTPNGTRYLDVINTQSNTVVGTYSYSGGGYSSQVAAQGTNVFWADQGDSKMRVLTVSAGGTPSLSRLDSLNLVTGVAALSGTYGATLQGTGDYMDIVNSSTGSVVHSTLVGSPAGNMFADTNTNLYYASITGSYKVVDTSGTILRTLSGSVSSIDSSAAHNFVYFVPSTSTHLLQQLSGANDAATGKSYDFGSGASINASAVDATTGNVWVALSTGVAELDSNLNLLGQTTLANPDAIAFLDGHAYVHLSGAGSLQVVSAIPEPGTWAMLAGLVGLVTAAFWRRRGTVRVGES